LAQEAIELLQAVAAELVEIHRAKDYSFWRDEARRRVGSALAQTDPFRDYANTWIFTGDGGGVVASGRFGDWAIDRLVDKTSPEEIIAAFETEVQRNAAVYTEVSPVFGLQIESECDLGDGITLVPEPRDAATRLLRRWPLHAVPLPKGTCSFCQSFTVAPAFERRERDATAPAGTSVTNPNSSVRDTVRRRVRLACLLVSAGPVELPISFFQPDRRSLFVAGEGNQAGRPYAAHPLASFPVDPALVKHIFERLGSFREVDSLARAIDRLGRTRLAVTPVDQALELGIAAEIALMHDHSPSNTEIAHKIGSRAAWLLGSHAAEREAIFTEMKQLYQARSHAVHSGALSSKSRVDLDSGDRFVMLASRAIVERGHFPDWNSLTMGGDGKNAPDGGSLLVRPNA
jgi:hypothetical protein